MPPGRNPHAEVNEYDPPSSALLSFCAKIPVFQQQRKVRIEEYIRDYATRALVDRRSSWV